MSLQEVKPIGSSNLSNELRKIQEELKRYKITNVINGRFYTGTSGTTIVCSPVSDTTGSAAPTTTDTVCRWS